jgi:hypothetical protein
MLELQRPYSRRPGTRDEAGVDDRAVDHGVDGQSGLLDLA